MTSKNEKKLLVRCFIIYNRPCLLDYGYPSAFKARVHHLIPNIYQAASYMDRVCGVCCHPYTFINALQLDQVGN
jgi:hypothetical protein